jgi:hypothetical protein
MSQNVPRKNPEVIIDPTGDIVWKPIITDHDSNIFYRGKTVTNQEFNDLFIKQVYQANYTADTLAVLLKQHLGTAIGRKFESDYKLVHSYIHLIATEADWGERKEDGYYYITIPASKHGFQPSLDAAEKGINIDTELYLQDPETKEYFEVLQIYTDIDNTVLLYTDDPRTIGVAVIRSNERAYALTGATLTTAQITDIAEVARTNSYNSLYDLPDITDMAKNTKAITDIIGGVTVVKNAKNAEYVTGYINNIPLDTIFEKGSSVVKNATHADKADYATNAGTADEAVHASNADNATNADYATSAGVARLADNAEKADKATNATNATNAVHLKDGTVAQLKVDAQGVLKVGDIVLPQKKLIVNNTTLANWNNNYTYSREAGVYEFILSFKVGSGIRYHTFKCYHDANTGYSYQILYHSNVSGVDKFWELNCSSDTYHLYMYAKIEKWAEELNGENITQGYHSEYIPETDITIVAAYRIYE